ncbi:hypothetical protein CQW23_28882 [Capsicum baccatum]|uniref:Uncharacterized protein n=1 Tax=Capsicum baccatum TaxID=33114 RepID=A0A2G2VHT2_CAPBA|nr:hypothetical protein CQW23_28882 [Capsicum baccatum]
MTLLPSDMQHLSCRDALGDGFKVVLSVVDGGIFDKISLFSAKKMITRIVTGGRCLFLYTLSFVLFSLAFSLSISIPLGVYGEFLVCSEAQSRGPANQQIISRYSELVSLPYIERHLSYYLNTLRLAAREVKELEFLRSAKNILELDLSNNKLEGRVPDWSNLMFALQHLNLSHNMLTSVDSIPFQYVVTIDLRSNVLQGSQPIPPNTTWFFFISQNNLSGKILSSICNSTSLKIRDLVRNNLSGEILQRLGNITALELGTLPKLQVLSLRSNELHGSIRTPTVENIFPNLRILDLSFNAFTENLLTILFHHLKVMRTIDPSKKEPSDGYYQDTEAVEQRDWSLKL